MDNKTVVIGGGASGLIAAILIARAGIPVVLFERNRKIGRKILASGNGQCNITNRNISADHFYSQNRDFVSAVLKGYSYEEVEQFFHSIGLPLVEGKEGKMFPMSRRSASVVSLLEYEAERAGVEIRCECTVDSISQDGELFVARSSGGVLRCANVILASGSPAAPQLGGNESGMGLAASLGHRLIPASPSLVQLCSDEKWVKQASGAKLHGAAKLYANGKYVTEKRGDLLFTNYGISGLAILDISREVSLHLVDYAYCELHLDLFPGMHKEKLTQFLLSRVEKEAGKPLFLWLTGILNEKLIPVVIEQSACRAVTEEDLDRREISRLVYALKNLKLPISSTRGFKGAEVATGGVDTTEVSPETMESLKTPGLYLTGELLDVDGDRGGFNFHFAWISGMRAAKGVISIAHQPEIQNSDTVISPQEKAYS